MKGIREAQNGRARHFTGDFERGLYGIRSGRTGNITL